MSEYRDSLDDVTRARYDEACAKAGAVLAQALADLQHDGRLPERSQIDGGQ